MTKKRGRPAFPTKHRTLNVYLPNDLHDRLGAWAAYLGVSRSHVIRQWVHHALNDYLEDEVDAVIKAKQKKVLGK